MVRDVRAGELLIKEQKKGQNYEVCLQKKILTLGLLLSDKNWINRITDHGLLLKSRGCFWEDIMVDYLEVGKTVARINKTKRKGP